MRYFLVLFVFLSTSLFAQNKTNNKVNSGKTTTASGLLEIPTVLFKNQSLEVMKEDEKGSYTYDQAKIKCDSYRNGWRLPTKDELNFLYKNKERIGGFKRDFYMSSEYVGEWNCWCQSFANGKQFGYSRSNTAKLRCVRTVK